MERRVVVTGGAGFIGYHVVRALTASGFDVVVIDNLSTGSRENVPPDVEFVKGDVLDTDLMVDALKGSTDCIHLAAVASVGMSIARYKESHAVNLGGLISVIEAIRRVEPQIQLRYASSAAVYGNDLAMPLIETATASPISPYGADKLACELHARAAADVFQIGSIGFRFFNVFGPKQDPNSPYSGVISRFISSLSQRGACILFGSGRQSRDFIYVEDVASVLVNSLGVALPRAPVVNVCTGVERSVAEVADAIAANMGILPQVEHLPPRDGDLYRSVGSTNHLAELLGLPDFTPFEVAIERTVRDACAQYPRSNL